MDNLDRIKYLLERFYEGSSSIQEERELSGLLQAKDLPDEYQSDKELFASFVSANSPVDIPENLNKGIIDLIDSQSKKESRLRRMNTYYISGLAAGLLLIFSVYVGFLRDNKLDSLSEFAVEDPALAYEETKKALDLISEKWNAGTSELRSLDEVNTGMRSVQPIQKLNSGKRELNLLGNLQRAEKIRLQ